MADGAKKGRRTTKRYNDEVKEQVYTMRACGSSIGEISRELGVPRQTVHGWIKAKKEADPDKFEEMRTVARRGFVERSTDIIDKGLRLLEGRFDAAIDDMGKLDEAVKVLTCVGLSEDLSDAELKVLREAAAKITAIKTPKLNELTIAIGTLYDKRALAQGDATERCDITAGDKALMAGVERIYARLQAKEGGED